MLYFVLIIIKLKAQTQLPYESLVKHRWVQYFYICFLFKLHLFKQDYKQPYGH